MLSVVIATRDSERALVPTLASLVTGAAAGLVREVIIADAISTDQTAAVADVAGCRILASTASVGGRLREAAAAAHASWLLFLRPGVVLDATWTDDVRRFIERAGQSGRVELAAVFRPAASGRRALFIEALDLMRLSLGGRPRLEQGLVIARALYESIGGHRAEAADPERDLLRRLGGRRIAVLRSAAEAVAET